jgi:tRNA (guanine26-N2/guanine27-N2)-dimethyltransferase
MSHTYGKVKIKEGNVCLNVPEISGKLNRPLDYLRSRAPVFFNPVMKLNRDTAVVVLSVYQKKIGRVIKICDPFCGSGVRGIRFSIEVPGPKKVIMGDLNPQAVKLSEENIRLNKVSGEVTVRLIEANLLMNIHSHPFARFDYLDIDPYGTPVPYLDSSIRASHDGSILAVTATDMAPLCGVNPLACIRKYGGVPLRVEYGHEVALRLLIGSIARIAAVHEVGIEPIFGFYADHYVRVYSRINKGAKKADDSIKKIGYIYHCHQCNNREEVKEGEHKKVCKICGGKMIKGGPMWLGEYADKKFCNAMQAVLDKVGYFDVRTLKIVNLIKNEIGFPPSFFNLDKLSSSICKASIPTEELLSIVKENRFNVVRTHFDPRGVKTDASISEIRKLLKE